MTISISGRGPVRSRTGAALAGAAAAVAVSVFALGGAAASTTTHTIRLRGVATGDVIVKRVDIATDKDLQHGQRTGYDVTRCVVSRTTMLASCGVAVARPRGLLYLHAHVDVRTGQGHGQVLGGTGGFAGATGTVTVAPGPNHSSEITITYQR